MGAGRLPGYDRHHHRGRGRSRRRHRPALLLATQHLGRLDANHRLVAGTSGLAALGRLGPGLELAGGEEVVEDDAGDVDGAGHLEHLVPLQ